MAYTFGEEFAVELAPGCTVYLWEPGATEWAADSAPPGEDMGEREVIAMVVARARRLFSRAPGVDVRGEQLTADNVGGLPPWAILKIGNALTDRAKGPKDRDLGKSEHTAD